MTLCLPTRATLCWLLTCSVGCAANSFPVDCGPGEEPVHLRIVRADGADTPVSARLERMYGSQRVEVTGELAGCVARGGAVAIGTGDDVVVLQGIEAPLESVVWFAPAALIRGDLRFRDMPAAIQYSMWARLGPTEAPVQVDAYTNGFQVELCPGMPDGLFYTEATLLEPSGARVASISGTGEVLLLPVDNASTLPLALTVTGILLDGVDSRNVVYSGEGMHCAFPRSTALPGVLDSCRCHIMGSTSRYVPPPYPRELPYNIVDRGDEPSTAVALELRGPAARALFVVPVGTREFTTPDVGSVTLAATDSASLTASVATPFEHAFVAIDRAGGRQVSWRVFQVSGGAMELHGLPLDGAGNPLLGTLDHAWAGGTTTSGAPWSDDADVIACVRTP